MNDIQRPMCRVPLTADFYDDAGNSKFEDLGLAVFKNSDRVEVTPFVEHRPGITPDQLSGCTGVIVMTPRVTAASLLDSEDLLAIGRFGVSFDSVDVDAGTERKVLAMITAGAVDRPVAEATIGWLIALAHHMLPKDQLVRTGQWDDRTNYMGWGLIPKCGGLIRARPRCRGLIGQRHFFRDWCVTA